MMLTNGEGEKELVTEAAENLLSAIIKKELPCNLKCRDCIESYDDHATCHKQITLDTVDLKRAVEDIIDKVEEMYEWFGLAEEKFKLKDNTDKTNYIG